MWSSHEFLQSARQQLPAHDRDIIDEHIPSSVSDIHLALTRAHDAAQEKQRACEDRRWTWKVRGRTILLRDEAAKVIAWLDRFKSAGDIAVNFDPVHAALPWAGIRLILEVSLHYQNKDFKAQLTSTWALVTESRQMGTLVTGMQTALHMIHRVKAYLEYLGSLPSSHVSSTFAKALLDLFVMVLGFLAAAIRTFQQSTVKRGLDSFFNGEACVNFQDKCDRLSDKVETDASNCDRELYAIGREDAAYQRSMLSKALVKLEAIANAQSSIDIINNRQVLNKIPIAEGASFDSYEERHNPLCLDGTRIEILEEVQRWSKNPAAKCIYWLNGMAGTGKSTIARSVADSFKVQGRLAASFLFKRGEGDRGNARRLLTTISLQIARNIPETEKKLIEAVHSEPEISQKSLSYQFDMLISGPLASLDHKSRSDRLPVIVIDALDECDEELDIRNILKMFAKAKSEIGVLVLITSRPELPIRLGFAEISGNTHHEVILQEVTKLTTKRDISLVLKREFDRIRSEHLLRRPTDSLPSHWPGMETIETLVNMADPLFIFAITMCRFIADRKGNPKKRLEKVLKQSSKLTLSKLDRTYGPIFEAILADQDDDDIDFTEELKEIIGPIIMLSEPLSIRALASLLQIPTEDISQRLDFLHSVLSVPRNESLPVRLLHLSFRDYLLDDQKRGKDVWWIDGVETHKLLAQKCLAFLSSCPILKHDMFNLKEPGVRRVDLGKRAVQSSISAELAYACIYWPFHWFESQQVIVDGGDVHEFLLRHLLHWLEALSWLGRLNQCVELLKNLHELTKLDGASRITELLTNIRRFIVRNRQIMLEAPLQLYSSALIFMPEQSLIRQTYFTSIAVVPWMKRLPSVPAEEGAEIQALPNGIDDLFGLAESPQFSSDCTILATVARSGDVKLWDILAGEIHNECSVQDLDSEYSDTPTLIFSNECHLLALAPGTSIYVWDMEVEPRKITTSPTPILTMAFSNDSSQLAVADKAGKLRFVSVADGTEEWVSDTLYPKPGYWTKTGGWNYTIPVAISLSERWVILAVDYTKQNLQISDTASGVYPRDFQTLPGVDPVALSHDSQKVIYRSHLDDRMLRICHIPTLQSEDFISHDETTWGLTFSPNDRILAMLGHGYIILLEVSSRRQIQRVPWFDMSWGLAISPDNTSLAVAGRKAVSLFEIQRGAEILHDEHTTENPSMVRDAVEKLTLDSYKERTQIECHHERVERVVSSRNSRFVASLSRSVGRILLWNWATGELMKDLEVPEGIKDGPTISHDGSLVTATSNRHTVRVWSAPEFRELFFFHDNQEKRHHHLDRFTVFSHGDTMLLSVAIPRFRNIPVETEGALRIWELTTGQEIHPLKFNHTAKGVPVFSWDDSLLAMSCGDHTIRVWNLSVARELVSFDGGADPYGAIAFSHDNQVLAIGQRNEILIHDIYTGHQIQRLTLYHANSPRKICFSKKFAIMGVSGDDWLSTTDLSTGQQLMTMELAQTSLLEFSDDERHIYTESGCVHLHDDCFDPNIGCSHAHTVLLKGQWITHCGKDSLWLPHERRPTFQPASNGSAIAIADIMSVFNIYGTWSSKLV